ncbi:TonB-dependent receptor [Phenylobacterium sp. Root700]|uniref:TonB-dependent receptor n=1 Tax=Phenylobacterium sp. Root700 TaxID=1736591 RepID=UPI0009E694F9|nr:TonB-dependent receptor [Phenylobacterium sp. Root700]
MKREEYEMKCRHGLAAITIAGSLFSTSAFAQSQGAGEPPELETVIVTATKREQSVQNVPIAVSAFSGESLADRGVADINNLQEVSPSLMINTANSTSNGGTIRIRGIGTIGNNIGLESAVGFFQDGAYRSRSGHALNELFDIQRVEVLRGPQGTLFGKNTSAGAISVYSKAPEFEFGGNLSASLGNLDYRRIEGVLTGPIAGDELAFRLSGAVTRRDGYMTELRTGQDINNKDRWALRGQLLWEPGDDFRARLIVDYLEKDERCCAASFAIVGPTGPVLRALGGTTTITDNGRTVGANRAPFDQVEDGGAVLDLEWRLGDATLTSISTYRHLDAHRGQDVDFTDVDLFQFSDTQESFESRSQELRLAGTRGSLDWLVGAYASSESIASRGRPLVTLGATGPSYFAILFGNPAVAGLLQPGNGVSASFNQKSTGWAVFTNNTWNISDAWYLNFGLRYTEESKKGGSVVNETGTAGIVDNNWPCALLPVPTFCGNAGYSLKRSDNNLTGTVKIGYKLSDDVNLYAGWSNGFKSGGFNLDPLAYKVSPTGNVIGDGREFGDETVDSFEAGLKSKWFDNRLALNIAVFHSTFKGFQVNNFTGTVFAVENMPEVVSRGVELESFLAVADGVFLNGGVTHTDATFTANTPITNATANLGGPTNLEGRQLTNAPRWQLSIGANIEKDLPFLDGWSYIANGNWMYRSDYNTGADLDPQKEQDAFSLLNLQVGLRSHDRRVDARLWINNVFDTDYKQFVLDSVLQTGSWHQTVSEPRTWGVTLRTEF